MTPTKVPYLCGGILFSLILQARKTRTKARDKYHGGSDGLKDTDVMMGLVEVVTGDSFVSSQGKTFGKCTTQFKTCQDYGTTYVSSPIIDPIWAVDKLFECLKLSNVSSAIREIVKKASKVF